MASVRARTTLAATLAVGLALAVAATGLFVLLRREMVQHVDDIAEARAEDVAALVRGSGVPRTIAVTDPDNAVVQVVDGTGRVVAASAGVAPDRPMATFVPRGAETEVRTVSRLPDGASGAFRVAALRVEQATVYAASTLEPVRETTAVLRNALLAGTPALLALVALTAWAVVGRALDPVEAIRAEVASISAESGGRRVPVPAADDEVARLAATMNTMLERLETAAERQRRFVADASHELRTPLAAVRTGLEVALAHPDSADWHETAASLLAVNRQMERLVQNLLFLARADGAAPLPPMAPVDLDDVVLAEVAAVRSSSPVPVDADEVAVAAVRGRRDDLARAVRNLLDNATRHASARVTVALAADDHHATLVVADDGPGIPVADRERVFERFGRLDTARTRDGGTGLGLAIVKEIVEAHGGTVEVADAAIGARLVVRLPLG